VGRHAVVVSSDVRADIVRRLRAGESSRSIASNVNIGRNTVRVIVRAQGGSVRKQHRDEVMRGSLSWEQRTELFAGLRSGLSYRTIAAGLGCSASTVCREVQRNGGRKTYTASNGQRSARVPIERCHPRKLDNPVLAERVTGDLKKLRSPEQIAGRLRDEFPDDASMHISHETIYKSLYVQGRGELKRELAACLRTGRAQRKTRGERSKRGKIPDMIMISDRPAEIEDRAVPGHWEGDLIIGAFGRSAIGTLVERTTRFVILLHLDGNHTAETVRNAMTTEICRLPEHLRRSITWDQGHEMSHHAQFTIDTGIGVYFCDPHSPWQRGTNENTNGLLRQYFPKSTDLSVHSPEHLRSVADSMNDRPRKTLNYRTPAEELNKYLLLSA
jgi:transposase, IS30 family